MGWVVKSLESRILQEEGTFEVYKNCKAHRDGAPSSARHAALSWMTTSASVRRIDSCTHMTGTLMLFMWLLYRLLIAPRQRVCRTASEQLRTYSRCSPYSYLANSRCSCRPSRTSSSYCSEAARLCAGPSPSSSCWLCSKRKGRRSMVIPRW